MDDGGGINGYKKRTRENNNESYPPKNLISSSFTDIESLISGQMEKLLQFLEP